MSPIRCAVVGAGWWSNRAHLPALAAHPGAEVVAVVDADAERARATASRFHVGAVLSTVDELLALEVDAAIVATPQGAHREVGAALLDAGVDVLVEKPLTVRADEAWDLVRRAESSGAKLHVGHTYPYHPAVIAARDAVRSGRLGDLALATGLFSTAVAGLYRGETEFARAHTDAPVAPLPGTYADPHSGGHLYSQLSHAVALLLFVTDDRPVTVTAAANRLESGVDRADAVTIVFASGMTASIAGAGTVHDHELRVEEYRIFGAGGHLALSTADATLRTAYAGAPVREETLPADDLSPLPARRLVDAALGIRPVHVTGALGAITVEVLEAARGSAAAGGAPRSIDLPAEEPAS